MLNKCSDRAWFVVELCESIKAFKIEIANFELYSSVPKDIRISMGNVHPARDKDWTLFGQFEAQDDRAVQIFLSSEGVFGKFVKVEIMSHYGNEHYCPISLFKIYGISEIELLGADDDDEPGTEDEPISSDVLTDPVSTTETPPIDNSIIKMFKEGFKMFVGVFAPNEQIKNLDMEQALNHSSLVGTTLTFNISCPSCDEEQFRDVYFLLAFNYEQLLQTLQKNTGLESALKSHVCQSYGFPHLFLDEGQQERPLEPVCSGFRLVEFYATLFGTSRIMALCNVINMHDQEQNAGLILRQRPSSSLNQGHENEDQKGQLESDPAETKETEVVDDLKKEGSETPEDVKGSASTQPTDQAQIKVTMTSSDSLTANGGSVPTLKPEDSTPKIVEKAPSPGSSKEVPKIKPTPTSDQGSTKKEEKVKPNAKTSNKSPESGPKEPPEVIVPPQTGTPPLNDGHPGSGSASGAGRESVWQKLSNKIKALERNVSLSGGYLEELSVQYKKQIEDLQLAVRQSGEALAAASKARENDRAQVRDLREEIGQLKIVVEEVSSRMENMSTWVSFVSGLLFFLRSRKKKSSKRDRSSMIR